MDSEQLSFSTQQPKYKYVENYNYIEKYKYIPIEGYKTYEFERDTSEYESVISSETNKEIDFVKIPHISSISAGTPIYIGEDFEENFCLPSDIQRTNKDLFILTVKGDSMINANINDSDLVLIRRNSNINKKSIIAVDIDGYATLKRFEVKSDKLILISENDNYKPIIVNQNEARIIGCAIGIIKKI